MQIHKLKNKTMKTAFLKNTILLLTSVICINFSFAQNHPSPRRSSSAQSSTTNRYRNINESSNNGESTINYKNGRDRYTIRIVQDKVTELYVNDKRIPADSIHLYQAEIDKILEQIKKDRAQAEEDRKQAELDRKQAEKDRAQAQLDRAHAEEHRKQAEKDREQAKLDMVKAEADRKQAEKDRQQALKDRAQAEEDRKQAELDRKQAEEDRALVKRLIAELIKQKIVSDEKDVTSVRLTNDEFYVNGKKQSEELHSKFKSTFLKKPGNGISFDRNSGYGTYMNSSDHYKKKR